MKLQGKSTYIYIHVPVLYCTFAGHSGNLFFWRSPKNKCIRRINLHVLYHDIQVNTHTHIVTVHMALVGYFIVFSFVTKPGQTLEFLLWGTIVPLNFLVGYYCSIVASTPQPMAYAWGPYCSTHTHTHTLKTPTHVNTFNPSPPIVLPLFCFQRCPHWFCTQNKTGDYCPSVVKVPGLNAYTYKHTRRRLYLWPKTGDYSILWRITLSSFVLIVRYMYMYTVHQNLLQCVR